MFTEGTDDHGRASIPMRQKGGVVRGALVSILLLGALLAGTCGDSASVPVNAGRWFFGLDEADRFALPLQPTGNVSSP